MYILCELSLYKKWIFCESVAEAKEEAVGRRFERESRGGRGLSARARRAGPSSGYKKAATEAPDAIISAIISATISPIFPATILLFFDGRFPHRDFTLTLELLFILYAK